MTTWDSNTSVFEPEPEPNKNASSKSSTSLNKYDFDYKKVLRNAVIIGTILIVIIMLIAILAMVKENNWSSRGIIIQRARIYNTENRFEQPTTLPNTDQSTSSLKVTSFSPESSTEGSGDSASH